MKKASDQFKQSEPTVIDTDATAQRIMIELGVWDKMSEQGGLAGNTNIMVADTHPTHWCLCGRIWDNANPNENGFIVIAFPKKIFPRSYVEAARAEYLRGSDDLTVEAFIPNPLD